VKSNFIFLLGLLTIGCHVAASYGPGFNFALFQDTRAEGLARAVESEDTALIRKYVVTDALEAKHPPLLTELIYTDRKRVVVLLK